MCTTSVISTTAILSSGHLNDLWRYRVSDNTWTWASGSDTVDQPADYGEKGAPTATSVPGSRAYSFGYVDSFTQDFWLFGGKGFSNTSETTGTCEKRVHAYV